MPPPSGVKPSEVAKDAKKRFIPQILKIFGPTTAYLYKDTSAIRISSDKRRGYRLRVAIVEGDPVNYALGWQIVSTDPSYRHAVKRIPVVNMANEKRAGGDWESCRMGPEECFARRSNLVSALTMLGNSESLYPFPEKGGVFSPQVYTVVFRDGPDRDYAIYEEMLWLPVISVAPVRRPKLDEAGTNYAFPVEKELMMEKMRSVLRIAAFCGFTSICIGTFGVGPVFRNPVGEVAKMWRRLLFEEDEFCGVFTDIVFAIENSVAGSSGRSNADVFRNEFDPSVLFPTTYQ